MNSTEIKARDRKYILGNYARNDLCIARGEGATCFSPEGKRYIDFSSGIGVNSLGYGDKGWAEAVTRQLLTVQHTSNLFYTEPCGRLAEMLIQRTGFDKVFFCNSGAEANEGAIKAARKYSFLKYGVGRHEIVTLQDSFHGRTLAALTATGQDGYHKYFHPFPEGFSYAKPNDLADLKGKISQRTCAVMIELVQGEGGVTKLEESYVSAVYDLCREQDLLLIVDEVQTGIGRTGTLFAYEQFGVRPHLVTMAKGLGAGLPIGGILFDESCSQVLQPGDHGTTFGGNPAVCAGGVEVLSRIDEEFLRQVARKGRLMKSRIEEMNGVAQVTGLGMMAGIVLKEKEAGEVVKHALELGLILLTAKSRIRLLPPLNITDSELGEGLELLEKAIGE